MPRQYWNEEKTGRSLSELRSVCSRVDAVLMGGWAVYMYANAQKSEDVDLAVGHGSLNYFRQFGISEYAGLGISYTTINGIVFDLFIEEHSDSVLPIPVRDILANYAVIDGIKVVDRNMLLILKLWGYFRQDATKLNKGIIDVLSLLKFGSIDLKAVKGLMVRYNIPDRRGPDVILEYLDKGDTLWEYVSETRADYAAFKDELKLEVRRLFY